MRALAGTSFAFEAFLSAEAFEVIGLDFEAGADATADRWAGAFPAVVVLCDGHDGRDAAITLPAMRTRIPPARRMTISLGRFTRFLTR
jgi:hypothetical protein